MPDRRPFRFGVQSFSASSAAEWRDKARRAEDFGYAVLSLADHFIGPGPAQERTNHPPQEFAAVPAIAMAAEATTQLRLGCRVFCIDYRHPVMLTKEAATLDLLSEGRLEIGLGAGWLAGEYAAADIPFERAGVRIAKLAEAVALLKMLMAEGQVSFKGEHFRVEGFEGRPKPVQRPHPPLMIGGGGERVLSLAAREADIVSFNFNNRSGVIGADGVQTSTAELTAQKVEWVTDQAETMVEGMGNAFGLSGDAMREHPHALFGSVDAICDELSRRRELYGISYVTVGDVVMNDFAPVVARLAGT
ncbi:MAG: TIGR03621 family F420-dependent LLM class oxidoreductase [Deltaproteobacteria bacterium]|nr:TIGR03621 family F420-dependent LLM class oxidoreductase [Deltaproteobacteria bacterium]